VNPFVTVYNRLQTSTNAIKRLKNDYRLAMPTSLHRRNETTDLLFIFQFISAQDGQLKILLL